MSLFTTEEKVRALQDAKDALNARGWTRERYKARNGSLCVLGAAAFVTCGLAREGPTGDPWYVPDHTDRNAYKLYCELEGDLDSATYDVSAGAFHAVSEWQDAQTSKAPVLDMIDRTITRLQQQEERYGRVAAAA